MMKYVSLVRAWRIFRFVNHLFVQIIFIGIFFFRSNELHRKKYRKHSVDRIDFQLCSDLLWLYVGNLLLFFYRIFCGNFREVLSDCWFKLLNHCLVVACQNRHVVTHCCLFSVNFMQTNLNWEYNSMKNQLINQCQD